MSVKLNNNTFINCKKAISAPEAVDFEMEVKIMARDT